MARRRRSPRRRTRPRVATARQRRNYRRRSKSVTSSDNIKTIVIATFAMNFISGILSSLLSKQIAQAGKYSYMVIPMVIIFLSRKGILPIKGVEAVAITLLANRIASSTFSSISEISGAKKSDGYGAIAGQRKLTNAIQASNMKLVGKKNIPAMSYK